MHTRVRYRIDFENNHWYSDKKHVKNDVKVLKIDRKFPVIYEITEIVDTNGKTTPLKEIRKKEEEL